MLSNPFGVLQGAMKDLNAALLQQRGPQRIYALHMRADTARELGDYQVWLTSTICDHLEAVTLEDMSELDSIHVLKGGGPLQGLTEVWLIA